MSVARDKGNAGNWTPADAIAQEAELSGVRDPSKAARIETHRTFEADRAKAEHLLKLAAKACVKANRGGLAEMKKSGDGYVIIITEPVSRKKK